MTTLEIFLAASSGVLLAYWIREIQSSREHERKLTQCREELAKLIQSIRQTNDIARKSKFVHFYP
jgi:hypothetical protein